MGDGAASSSILPMGRPQRRDMPSSKEQDGDLARVLSKIDSAYAEACDRLAVQGRAISRSRTS